MINTAIVNRRSVRNLTDQSVADELILEIIKAGQFAPSAMNRRGSEFLVVKDQATKERLFEITSKKILQEVVRTAPVLLIPVVNTQASVLPVPDLSLVIENIFLQVSELGLGAFWKNVSAEEAEEIKALLNIPAHFTLLCVIPIGYPLVELKPHSEEEFETAKIHWGQW